MKERKKRGESMRGPKGVKNRKRRIARVLGSKLITICLVLGMKAGRYV